MMLTPPSTINDKEKCDKAENKESARKEEDIHVLWEPSVMISSGPFLTMVTPPSALLSSMTPSTASLESGLRPSCVQDDNTGDTV